MSIKSMYSKVLNWITIQSITRRSRATKYIVGTSVFTGFTIGLFKYLNVPFDTQKIMTSGVYGLSHLNIPYFMRSYLFSRYANKYEVNLQQAQKDIKQYSNFSQFFTRTIKQRPHQRQSRANPNTICSPCDGQILNISKIQQNSGIIIKDIKYSLSKLLFELQQKKIVQKLKFNSNNDLYQIIIYLGPGDYHRFHSPYKMFQKGINDIQGSLKSVNIKSLIKNGSIVYEQNARRVINGYYVKNQVQRYLGLCMIGALNVGRILIKQKSVYEKGQEIGYFDLGSTIVMVVEVDPKCKIYKKDGDKVKFGEAIWHIQ